MSISHETTKIAKRDQFGGTLRGQEGLPKGNDKYDQKQTPQNIVC